MSFSLLDAQWYKKFYLIQYHQFLEMPDRVCRRRLKSGDRCARADAQISGDKRWTVIGYRRPTEDRESRDRTQRNGRRAKTCRFHEPAVLRLRTGQRARARLTRRCVRLTRREKKHRERDRGKDGDSYRMLRQRSRSNLCSFHNSSEIFVLNFFGSRVRISDPAPNTFSGVYYWSSRKRIPPWDEMGTTPEGLEAIHRRRRWSPYRPGAGDRLTRSEMTFQSSRTRTSAAPAASTSVNTT